MIETGLYIEVDGVVKRLDTFDDEKIQITSSIQNVNDISKVFTDYSQTFSVPASRNNNEIFKHWYENANDNGFDQRIRYKGYIEIDTQLFRNGNWQIESATIKDGQVNSYKITFLGVLRSLTDLFGEDKLENLELLNNYNFAYNLSAVQNRLQSNGDVIFPLISSERVWQYGGGGANDISVSGNAIDILELFPAVKVRRIFQAIQSQYNINFFGDFLNDTRFINLCLWFKNRDKFDFTSSISNVNITSNPTGKPSNSRWTVSTANNTLTNEGFVSSTREQVIAADITPSNPNAEWTLFVYRNGILQNQFTGTGSLGNFLVLKQTRQNQNNQLAGVYTFQVQTSVPDTVSITFRALTRRSTGFPLFVIQTIENRAIATVTTTANLSIPQLAPDIKVADFFSGILKMFNLTCFSEDEVNYEIQQLERWYGIGQIKDITKYVTTDLTFERFKAYKEINFKYQKSESFINRNFADTFNREYGDLSEKFNNDGSDFTIQLPFEKLKYNRLSLNLHCAYSLTNPPDFKPYIPKPVLFYAFGNVDTPIFFLKGAGTTNQLTSYCQTGDIIRINNEPTSINWGIEQVLGNTTVGVNIISNSSLFFNYYSDYLTNLYDLKSRIVKCKAIFSLPFLNNLKLNDRVIIRDKRYTINQMMTDLTTGEVDLELIQDFREVEASKTIGVINLGKDTDFEFIVNDPDEQFTVLDPASLLISSNKSPNNDYAFFGNVGVNTDPDPQQIVFIGDKGSEITLILE